ncbi:hypothetical protein TRVA0_001S01332 [Trichomonascus vanleenenianus]|uniref:uncharacterized protein n=1 Tax=Trichomonascus vanleenenianus TaxID=2268995 RepID=UPI003EC975F3
MSSSLAEDSVVCVSNSRAYLIEFAKCKAQMYQLAETKITRVSEWDLGEGRVTCACWTVDDRAVLFGSESGALRCLSMDSSEIVTIESGQRRSGGRERQCQSIAVSPCDEVFAVGYRNGEIVVYDGARVAHHIRSRYGGAIESLAFHPSATSRTQQTLAVFVNSRDQQRLVVYSMDTGRDMKKIRDVEVCDAQGCAGTVQWARNGRVVVMYAQGLAVFDVRTRCVSMKSVPTEDGGRPLAFEVDRHADIAWMADDTGLLGVYCLESGFAVETALVGADLGDFLDVDHVEITQSPVVRMHRASANEIVIRSSPRSPRSPQTPHSPTCGWSRRPEPQAALDSNDGKLKYTPRQMMRKRESFDFTPATVISTAASPGSPEDVGHRLSSPSPTNSSFSTCSVSSAVLVATMTHAGMVPEDSLANSLLPDVLADLLYQPKAVDLPTSPVLLSRDYIIRTMFGQDDIVEAVRNSIGHTSSPRRKMTLRLLIGDMAPHHLLPPEIDDELIGSDAGDELHMTCALLCANHEPQRALSVYRRLTYYMEALVVALIYDLDWRSIMAQWANDEHAEVPGAVKAMFGSNHATVEKGTLNFTKNYSRKV